MVELSLLLLMLRPNKVEALVGLHNYQPCFQGSDPQLIFYHLHVRIHPSSVMGCFDGGNEQAAQPPPRLPDDSPQHSLHSHT